MRIWSTCAARRVDGGATLGALVCLLAVVAPLTAQGTGTIRGRVISEGAGEPLPAAVVEIVGADGLRAVVSGGSGGYEILEVPAGRRTIRARHIGHAPLEIEVMVPAGGSVLLDLALRVVPVPLEPVRVDAGSGTAGVDTVRPTGAELGIAGARAMDATPGIAEMGLGEPVQRGPSQEPPDPADVLYVRGASADLKLVYLDGAPVYAPFALGGVADVFIPDVLQTATVFLGGAPARYDGGLSYVMDLRTRGVRSDRLHASGAMDLLASRLAVEGPLVPGVGLLAAGRVVHGAGAVEPLPYGYSEGLVRVDAGLGAGMHLHATGFANAEEVWLDEDAGAGSTVSWGNAAASLRLVAPFAGGEMEITGSTGSYQARLPRQESELVFAQGGVARHRLAADVSDRRGGLLLRYGASFDRISHRYSAWNPEGASVQTSVTGATAGAYAEVAWQAATSVRVRGGLRADHFFAGDRLVLAPRFSVTLLATDRASVTAAAGRYHQYLRASEAGMLLGARDSVPPSGADLSVGASTHVTMSLDQILAEGTRMGLEGFFKSYEGMPAEPTGAASSSGVDVWLSHDVGGWTGWAGYSLAWVWAGAGQAPADRFAGRHLISGGVRLPIAPRTRLGARVAYGSGLAYAALVINPNSPNRPVTDASRRGFQSGSDANLAPIVPSPDRPYLRVDLSATHAASIRVAGRDVAVESYLKLLNSLGRRDALFYRYEQDRGEGLTALAVLPIIPVIGLEWHF